MKTTVVLLLLILLAHLLQGQTNTFPSSGNVGIGTISPIAKLHVKNGDNTYGTILGQANESSFQLYTKTLITQLGYVESFRIGLKYNTDENNGFISFYRGGGTNGGFLGFSTFGIERIRISNTGNVGIGTSAPSAKLEVIGNIKAQEIKVTLASVKDLNLKGTLAASNIIYAANGQTADDVFDNDFRLEDLSEIESFIKTNKHLPGVPSAAQMEESGVNLAQMNKLLLQKIEELTLYAIQKDKDVSQLMGKEERMVKEVRELKERNEKTQDRLDQIETLLKDKHN